MDKLTPDFSERGDNTHLVRCETYNGMRHYAVCLRINKLVERGEARPVDTDCQRTIRCQECPAAKMRKEELAAGEALYYTRREDNPLFKDLPASKSIDVLSVSSQVGWEKGAMACGKRKVEHLNRTHYEWDADTGPAPVTKQQAAPVRKAAATPKPAAPAAPSGNFYADLVNKMMKEHKEKNT